MATWILKPLLQFWRPHRQSTAPSEEAEKKPSKPLTKIRSQTAEEIVKKAVTNQPSDKKRSKPVAVVSSAPTSLPPAPASLPPPSIPIYSRNSKSSATSIRIPSLSSRPDRLSKVPPPPASNRPVSLSQSPLRLICQADLDQAQHDTISNHKKLESRLDKIDQQIKNLEDLVKNLQEDCNSQHQKYHQRLDEIEHQLTKQQEEWYAQIEDRDEALFDQKVLFEAEFAKLATELNSHNSRVDQLKNVLGQIQNNLDMPKENLDLPLSSADGEGDNLTNIKGIGPNYERALKAIGVTTYAQIAEWTKADIDRIAAYIKVKPYRILREGWKESAKTLAATINKENESDTG